MDTFLHDATRTAILELGGIFEAALSIFALVGLAAVVWLAWGTLAR